MLMKEKDLTGYVLNSRDGEIGKVKDFFFDDRTWDVRYLVADTGSWLAERCVLISPQSLTGVNVRKRQIDVDLTKAQIEDSPPLDSDQPVSQQFETSFYEYYGWPLYWVDSPVIVHNPEKAAGTNSDGKEWNPNLRSTNVIRGYHLQAKDGEIGHVDDYILDVDTWTIHYMIVDTRTWILGKKVLISPEWIDHLSWDDSKVFVNLSREAVEKSPVYSEKDLLTREYETKLHEHYNRVGYWIEIDKEE